MKPYSALSDDQRAQVAYLFADDRFGTDATCYVYEVNAGGVVTRRMPTTDIQTQTTTTRVKDYQLQVARDERTTKEQVNHAMMHMDALAVSIADKLYQSQLEEVNK